MQLPSSTASIKYSSGTLKTVGNPFLSWRRIGTGQLGQRIRENVLWIVAIFQLQYKIPPDHRYSPWRNFLCRVSADRGTLVPTKNITATFSEKVTLHCQGTMLSSTKYSRDILFSMAFLFRTANEPRDFYVSCCVHNCIPRNFTVTVACFSM